MPSNDKCLDARPDYYGLDDRIFQRVKDLTVPVTTADGIPDKEYQVIGPVLGCVSLDSASEICKHFYISRLGDHDGIEEYTRIQAIHRMTIMATKLGGDAVIGMRFDFADSRGHCAYGVAVKFIKKKAQLPKDDDQSSVSDTATRVSEWTSLSSNTA